VTASAGVRADEVRFEVRDRLVTGENPDDSGRRSLRAVSPIAGLVARIARAHSVYANLSAAFETPTATELGNQPDGSAGINAELDPQRSTTIELGAKGFMKGGIHYDAAVFDTRVRDELVAFEIPESDGRRFFRNAGRTRRRGAEAGVDAKAGWVSMMLAYSYSHFRFEEYTTATSDFARKFIPGIPRHRLQGALTLRYRSGFGTLETELSGSPFVDDANTTRAPGYELAHLRAGFSPLRGVPRLSVTVGLQNIFDRKYAASLAVNAARGRYYEPAPGRTAYFGVTVGAGTGAR
jgi:iron complex outermembrane receptor protein